VATGATDAATKTATQFKDFGEKYGVKVATALGVGLTALVASKYTKHRSKREQRKYKEKEEKLLNLITTDYIKFKSCPTEMINNDEFIIKAILHNNNVWTLLDNGKKYELLENKLFKNIVKGSESLQNIINAKITPERQKARFR
jgi:hypothetical protein